MANAQHFPEHYYSFMSKKHEKKEGSNGTPKNASNSAINYPKGKLVYFFHKDSEI